MRAMLEANFAKFASKANFAHNMCLITCTERGRCRERQRERHTCDARGERRQPSAKANLGTVIHV